MTKQSYKILIAEDNIVNLKLINRILTKLNHIPETAHNGHEVLQLLQHNRFDFILMDIQMPGMDGLETTRRIMASMEPSTRPIIIAMTANAMKGDKEICLAAGMDDYLSKPIIIKELEKKLCDWGELREEMSEQNRQSELRQLDEPIHVINFERLEFLLTLEPSHTSLLHLFNIFFSQCKELLKKLHQELEERNIAGMLESAHGLRGASLNYGALQVSILCEQLERQLQNKEVLGLLDRINQIDTSFELTSQLISDWLQARS